MGIEADEARYASGVLSHLMSVAGNEAMDEVMRTAHYMHGTRELGIRYRLDGHNQLTAQYDSSFDPDAKGGKITEGWIIKIFGASIAWLSKKSMHVAMSSTHA